MKERHIKAWPETVHYLPSISPFQRLAGHENDVRIDFSGCQQFTSTGLTVFLLRLLNQLDGKERKWTTDNIISSNPFFETIVKLGFFKHLGNYYENKTLLSPDFNGLASSQAVEHEYLSGRKVKSFPILRLDFTNSKSERRNAIIPFRKAVLKNLIELGDYYRIHPTQLVLIFVEIAKNCADHTNKDAFFGMDLIHIPENNSIQLHFVFGDLGNGIHQHIKECLSTDIKLKRSQHLGLPETYYYALKHGFTSTPESERYKNKGLGMTLILDGAKGIDMSLSVFDANSRGILSSIKLPIRSHIELRSHFFPFTQDKTFYYYGMVESEAV